MNGLHHRHVDGRQLKGWIGLLAMRDINSRGDMIGSSSHGQSFLLERIGGGRQAASEQ